MSALRDIETDIKAEWAKVRALAHEGALLARKANLLAELDKIEADLKQFVENVLHPSPPAPSPAPAPKAEAPAPPKKAPAKTEPDAKE